MKFAFAALALVVLTGTGCAHHGIFGTSQSALHSSSGGSSGKCPPGHRWSDGECHSTGKGHDPAKHGK